MDCFFTERTAISPTPIVPVLGAQLSEYLTTLDDFSRQWIANIHFKAEPGTYCLLPTTTGQIHQVLLGVANRDDFWQVGALPIKLPPGHYQLDDKTHVFADHSVYERALFAWGSISYRFAAYLKHKNTHETKLLLPETVNAAAIQRLLSSIYLARDLINTPAEDLGPPELADAVMQIAKDEKAKVKIIVGEDLRKQNWMSIYMVGRAGHRPPHLIDLTWGEPTAPKVTLVGKGVCFDSGGLDLKNSDGMRDMKKDMGGAALSIALAKMIMSAQLPVRLRLLIAAVENAVDSSSYRPGDIIKTRGGFSVEISNTDAEGRVVLCDALAEAVTESPDLLLDFATLTGAARIALGPDLPVLFSNNELLASNLLSAAQTVQDPIWRLPLYQPYLKYLRTPIADMMNAANTRFAGSITAALFLQKFIPESIPWAHFDIFAQNHEDSPGRPLGGDVFPLRAVFHYLSTRFS